MVKPLPLAAALLPLAAAVSVNTTGLRPWEITAVYTHTPSGYPANHPYSWVGFSVSDPNDIVVGQTHFGPAEFSGSATNCSVRYLGYGHDDPRGKTYPCAASTSLNDIWSFEILKESYSVTTNFTLRVVREEAVVLASGGIVNLRWEGRANFTVGYLDGENMSGACGGSGVCSWGLKADYSPVRAAPRLLEVQCVAGDCSGSSDSSS